MTSETIHIYFMAPLNPSPTQLRAQTLCKIKVAPVQTASAEHVATCEQCLAKGKELRDRAQAVVEKITAPSPSGDGLRDYVARFDVLLGGSKEVHDG